MNSIPDGSSPQFVSHSQAARMRGVSGRTLDRWAAAGIIPAPTKINERKYHEVDKLLAVGAATSSNTAAA